VELVMLTAERVRELLDYDPKTGQFTWKKSPGYKRLIGKAAGCTSPTGYVQVGLYNKLYYAHRLAWLWMTGDWPKRKLDHRNGNGLDNSFGNLREATHAQNMQNSRLRKDNTTGYRGVCRRGEKFQARIRTNGRSKCLGTFATVEEAARVREEAVKQVYGEYGRL
jgi:hypothetical protein